eukprot:764734-Hanusia_phi.AAC.1
MFHPDTLQTVDYGLVLDNMSKFKIEDGWSLLGFQQRSEREESKGRFLGEVRYQTTNLFETPVAPLVPGSSRSSFSVSEHVHSTESSSSGKRRKKCFKPHPEVVFKKYATAEDEITMDAIKKCFDELQIIVPDSLVEERFRSLDVNKNGVLDYNEFMAIYREGNRLDHADRLLLDFTAKRRLHEQAMDALEDYMKLLKGEDETRLWLEDQMSFHDLDMMDEGEHKLLWTESKMLKQQRLHAKLKEKLKSAWKGVKGQVFMLRYGHLMNKSKSAKSKSKNEPCMKGWLSITDEEDARPNHVQWTSRFFVLRKNQDLQWFVGEKEFLNGKRSLGRLAVSDFQLYHEFPQLKGKANVFALRSLPPHAQTEWQDGDNRQKWIYFAAGTAKLREKWTGSISTGVPSSLPPLLPSSSLPSQPPLSTS